VQLRNVTKSIISSGIMIILQALIKVKRWLGLKAFFVKIPAFRILFFRK